MMKWSLVATCAATGVAQAEPKLPQCVPGDVSGMKLFGAGGRAIACWSDTSGCVTLDDNKVVPRPGPDPRAASVRADGGKPSACNAKSCKPLGERLAAAVAAAGKDDVVTVTSGLEIVAIDADKTHALWNVAQDKQLAPKQPAALRKTEKWTLSHVEAVGAKAFATWSEGAPFGKEIVVEPSGANHSKAFDAGDTVVLANGLYAVMGASSLLVLDQRGRHAGKLDLKMSAGMDGSQPMMIGIGNNEVVVLSAYLVDQNLRTFAHATIAASGTAKVGKTGTIPTCSDE